MDVNLNRTFLRCVYVSVLHCSDDPHEHGDADKT